MIRSVFILAIDQRRGKPCSTRHLVRSQLQNALHENLGQCGRYELLRANPLFELPGQDLRTDLGRECALHGLPQQSRKRDLPLMATCSSTAEINGWIGAGVAARN